MCPCTAILRRVAIYKPYDFSCSCNFPCDERLQTSTTFEKEFIYKPYKIHRSKAIPTTLRWFQRRSEAPLAQRYKQVHKGATSRGDHIRSLPQLRKWVRLQAQWSQLLIPNVMWWIYTSDYNIEKCSVFLTHLRKHTHCVETSLPMIAICKPYEFSC